MTGTAIALFLLLTIIVWVVKCRSIRWVGYVARTVYWRLQFSKSFDTVCSPSHAGHPSCVHKNRTQDALQRSDKCTVGDIGITTPAAAEDRST